MELTILGNNGPFPGAGGACSGYLIREEGVCLLIDCGNGVLSNLQKFISFEQLDAIILTHLHSDHMSDMMVLKYAVQIKRKRGLMDKVLQVYTPEKPEQEYKMLDVKDAFNLNLIDEQLELNFGKIKVTFSQMKHPVKSFAVSVDNGVKCFVYSGDTSWNANIIEFSKNADVLMLDSGLLSQDKTDDNAPHLTARECGVIAAKSAVKKLLLTHLWPYYNLEDILKEAKENFENAEVSKLLHTYII